MVADRSFRWCRSLCDVAQNDTSEVGAKAAILGELLHAGFPVPPGFVITVAAFDAETAGRPYTVEGVRALPLDDALRGEIAAALANLGDGPVAVRSSAIAEDGSRASFAGQYATLLGVKGLEAVFDAVRECWASTFAPHVTAYERSMRHDVERRMAVLVQRQLLPRCAGVAFSADPRTGDPNTVVINAVSGLGEQLVSGRASPDSWSVKGTEAVCETSFDDSLSRSDATAVADLARRVARRFAVPQDIEWAFTGDMLHLLQARPLTALTQAPVPVPVPVNPPPGFWERNDTYYPHPLSPMFRSFFLDGLERGFRRFFAECGALAAGTQFREIGGWVYLRFVPLGGRDVPRLPLWLMWLALRLVPTLRRRVGTAVESIRSDRFGAYIDRWSDVWRPALMERARAARALDKTRLSDSDLVEHVETMAAFVREALEIHFLVIGAHFFPMADLAFTCQELLGWDEQQCLALFAGLSPASTEPALALESLAIMAGRRSRVLESILQQRPLGTVVAEDAEFGVAFDRYLDQYGHRVLRYEISEPTVAEQPELVLAWLRGQLVTRYNGNRVRRQLDERRQAALYRARALLMVRPTVGGRFERALERATRAYPLREDNEVCTCSVPLAVMRYAALELGRRLAGNGSIDRADHVFWLTVPEALAALGDHANVRQLVHRRRGEQAWVRAHPGPRSYGKRPQVPDAVPGLPPEAEFVLRAGWWMRDHGFAPAESSRQQMKGARISGIAAAGGSYTGPVRVVRSEAEFVKVQPGDVLVCPVAAPVWSVLFGNIGALITDTGGLLSHSAIIAREFGIPAVVATGNASQVLCDGQTVTVDGDAAEVRVLDGGPSDVRRA